MGSCDPGLSGVALPFGVGGGAAASQQQQDAGTDHRWVPRGMRYADMRRCSIADRNGGVAVVQKRRAASALNNTCMTGWLAAAGVRVRMDVRVSVLPCHGVPWAVP